MRVRRICRAGLSVKAFDESDKLRDFFNVISVTADRDGVFYVSTMGGQEGRYYSKPHCRARAAWAQLSLFPASEQPGNLARTSCVSGTPLMGRLA